MKIISNSSMDSILLMIVKAFTTISGILCTAILSHSLSLELYGTYSQLNLVITTTSSLTAIGLMDAINYYYNKTENEREQKENVDTILGLHTIIGIIAGCVILCCNKLITNYFNNPLLYSMYIYIAFRPLFANIGLDLQVLQISIGRAKGIAIRNAALSISRLVAIIITAYITYDIKTILLMFLGFDIIIMFYFSRTFEKSRFKISWFQINWKKAKEILTYSIPMGIYILTNSLSRDLDKLVVGRFAGTEQLAIYTNCATLLPFDIVSASFLTVIIPIMTRYINSKELDKGRKLFENYLKIGYITTITFTIACIVLSKEIILLLYGEKYLVGRPVFVLYTIVDMLKFANLSLVLSANGETKTLMKYSILALVANLILNLLFYAIFGFVGPAISTVIITCILTISLTRKSAYILETNLKKVIDWKQFIYFFLETVILGIILFVVENKMSNKSIHYLVILFVLGLSYVGGVLVLNSKKLIFAMKEIR